MRCQDSEISREAMLPVKRKWCQEKVLASERVATRNKCHREEILRETVKKKSRKDI